MPSPGYTYFVRSGDLIKIGFSIYPKKRFSSMQTGSAAALEMLAVVPSDLAGEYETHQRFAHLRERGEWFRAEPELTDFIASLNGEKAKPPAWANLPHALRKVFSDLHSIRIKHHGRPEIIERVTIAMGCLGTLQDPEGRAGQHADCRRNLSRAMTELAAIPMKGVE